MTLGDWITVFLILGFYVFQSYVCYKTGEERGYKKAMRAGFCPICKVNYADIYNPFQICKECHDKIMHSNLGDSEQLKKFGIDLSKGQNKGGTNNE